MIEMSKVNEAVVTTTMVKLQLSGKGTLEQRVKRLQAQQKKDTPKKRMSEPCSECGGESDINLPACPFCGAEGIDVPEGGVAPDAPPDKPPAEVQAEADAAQALAKVKGNGKDHGEPLVPVKAPQLDQAVREVRAAQEAGVVSYYDLGKALLAIFAPQLWKQRVTAEGKPIYRGFNQFVQGELNISHTQAYQLMQCAEHFTREQFLVIGMAKLVQILKLDPAKRVALLKEAKAGKVTVASLKELVAAEAPAVKKGRGKDRSAGSQAAADKRRAARAQKDGEVTAVSALGKVTVNLFQRPKGGKKDDPKRAIALHQDPWGTEELANGVVVSYRIVKQAKGLVLIVERNRRAGA